MNMSPSVVWKITLLHSQSHNLGGINSKSNCEVQSLSRVRLCDTMDCSPPGSSIHGIFQARILGWVAISFSRGSSRPRIFPGFVRIKPRSPTLQAGALSSEPKVTLTNLIQSVQPIPWPQVLVQKLTTNPVNAKSFQEETVLSQTISLSLQAYIAFHCMYTIPFFFFNIPILLKFN